MLPSLPQDPLSWLVSPGGHPAGLGLVTCKMKARPQDPRALPARLVEALSPQAPHRPAQRPLTCSPCQSENGAC